VVKHLKIPKIIFYSWESNTDCNSSAIFGSNFNMDEKGKSGIGLLLESY
jgi:hypothetical protein